MGEKKSHFEPRDCAMLSYFLNIVQEASLNFAADEVSFLTAPVIETVEI